MSPALAERELALAGIALLAAMIALGLTSHGDTGKAGKLPQPVLAPGGGWYSALAGGTSPRVGVRTDCGVVLHPGTIGLADSVLPCGIRVYVAYKDSPQVLTQVIARRPVAPDRTFELTPRLAETLGVDGVQKIRWVFAR